jgi:hypothetical protein
MTDCSEHELRLEGPGKRSLVARFDGGRISSDGGALLLHAVERRTRIVERFARCFSDYRDAARVEHSVAELARQRVFGLCLGYEDVSDHDTLRDDPLLAAVAGKCSSGAFLAGKSTFSRLELSTGADAASDRYKRVALRSEDVDSLLVEVFLERFLEAPASIVIDLDTTDFELHGRQEGRFFHGYYDEFCYLPLYVFCGDHLLCARLRMADRDASDGAKDEIERIVRQLRARWPSTRITLRADSGFCREELMSWCEHERVDYVFGIARNARLIQQASYTMALAAMDFAATGKASRRFCEIEYRTMDSWSRSRRVVAKAEYIAGKENPRFVVTSISHEELDARQLYEDLYCARGEMENRIKEQQHDLFAGRVSTPTMAANQVRLYFASIAYTLMRALREYGLAGSELERAQCGTIRLRLLKIGAQIKVSVRRVRVALSQAFPLQQLFAQVIAQLAPPRVSTA